MKMANCQDDARSDVRVREFWSKQSLNLGYFTRSRRVGTPKGSHNCTRRLRRPGEMSTGKGSTKSKTLTPPHGIQLLWMDGSSSPDSTEEAR